MSLQLISIDRAPAHFIIRYWILRWVAGILLLVIMSIVYPKKYAHDFVVLCFVVVMQSFIMNSHEVFIHIHQGCFAGTGAIVRLPQCQWSKPGGYGKISQCITTTKHSKAKTVCIFLGLYCTAPAMAARAICFIVVFLAKFTMSLQWNIPASPWLTCIEIKLNIDK